MQPVEQDSDTFRGFLASRCLESTAEVVRTIPASYDKGRNKGNKKGHLMQVRCEEY